MTYLLSNKNTIESTETKTTVLLGDVTIHQTKLPSLKEHKKVRKCMRSGQDNRTYLVKNLMRVSHGSVIFSSLGDHLFLSELAGEFLKRQRKTS